MKTSHVAVLAAAALSFLIGTAFVVQADISNPDRNRNESTAAASGHQARLLIVKDPRLTAPKLVLPRNLVASLDANGTVGSIGSLGPSPVQGIAAGLAMSLSAVCGGLFLVRLRRAGKRVAPAVGACLLFILGTAGFALANAAPWRERPLTDVQSLIPSYGGITGVVTIEIVSEGDDISLVLPYAPER